MITVRFPNGQAVTYNQAFFARHNGEHYTLQDREGGRAIAFVPYASGAIVELDSPCRVENPLEGQAIEAVLCYLDERKLREFASQSWRNRKALAEIKRILRNFDLRTNKFVRR